MFKIRMLTEDDYVTLLNWWKGNRFPAPEKEYLPENGTGGIMVYKDDVEICAGFIYFTNSKLVWIEFIVANHEYKSDDRTEAIQSCINELTGIAKRRGFKAAFTSIKNQNLIKHFEACGYSKGSNNTTEMIIKL